MNAWSLAYRTLRRRPSVVATILVTGGIAMTALVVAAAVADPVLFRTLPYPDADRLVLVREVDARAPEDQKGVSPADFHDLLDLGAFEAAAAWMNWNFNLTGAGVPQRLVGSLVSEHFFATLGVAPLHGRALGPADHREGGPAVVVISHRLWRGTFGSDPHLIGATIRLGGDPVEVVGVMPRDFRFPDDEVDLWWPLVFGIHFQPDDRGGRNLRVVARLGDGVSVEAARSATAVLAGRLAAVEPQTHERWSFSVSSLREAMTAEIRPLLLLFASTAIALLVIAVANTANLLLMLVVSRRREIATQAAIGAARPRIILQTVAQALILGVAVAAVSLGAAFAIVPLIARLGIDVPFAIELTLGPRVAAFAIATAIVATLLAALAPAWLVARMSLRGTPAGLAPERREGSRFRSLLVVIQIAIACALLLSTTLLAKSLVRLVSVDPGFDPRNVATARVWLPSSYETSAEQAAFFDTVLERLASTPGVESAAAIQDLPLRGNAMTFAVAAEVRREPAAAAWRVVSDGYFETMRIPIARGRGFTSSDRPDAPPVAIVNRTLALRLFGTSDPLGRRVRIGEDGRWATVVGVAGDVRHRGLAAEEIPAAYEPVAQKERDFLRWTTLTVRTTTAPSPATGETIRRVVASVDPNQPVYEIASLEELVRRETAPARIAASLVGALAVAALLVALTGIGGVLSYAVALRRRELGIRSAIGASPRSLIGIVVREALLLGAVGTAAGVLVAAAFAPLLAGVLFDTPLLERELLVVAAAVIGLAIAASIPPARRAAATDPATALRAE